MSADLPAASPDTTETLIQRCVVSDERKQPHSNGQARSQRRRMSQPSSLSDCFVAPCQCLVGKAEAEKDTAQKRLRVILRVESSLMDK